jgi:predicted AlkP superfamily pyrophosphatase or phosphodiesterase
MTRLRAAVKPVRCKLSTAVITLAVLGSLLISAAPFATHGVASPRSTKSESFIQVPPSQTQAPSPQKEKPSVAKEPALTARLILISINGLTSDHIVRPERYQFRIPNLISLRDRGTHAVAVESVYPSLSLPAHATMVTGMLPVDHEVYSDEVFDRSAPTPIGSRYTQLKSTRVDTIWSAARRSGLKTAVIDFPLTHGAAIDSRESNSGGTRAMIDFLAENRAHLTLINLDSFEKAQVEHGVSSRQAIAALEGIDARIGEIAALSDSKEMTFIIVSDAGRSPVEREFRPNVLLAKKGYLTAGRNGQVTEWKVVCQSMGGSAAVFVKPGFEKMMADVEKLFQEAHEKTESPIWRIMSARDAARLGADPRATLFLDAAPLYMMSSEASGGTTEGTDARAAGGYLPQRSEMRAALIVSGRGVKGGVKLDYARLIDVAPTVARLLGLELRTARGRVLNEAIDQ